MIFDAYELKALIRMCDGVAGPLVSRGYGWQFLFVLTKGGITIGRITLKDGELHSLRSYKKDYHTEIDVTDLIFFRIEKFIQSNGEVFITKYQFHLLEEKAKKWVEDDKNSKLARRRANPPKIDPKTGKPKRRRSIKGRSVRSVLQRMIAESPQLTWGDFR